MIINHTNKFIFFKPLKTAGTSIEAFLSKSCDQNDFVTGPAKTDDISLEPEFYERNNRADNNLYRFHGHTYPALLYKKTGRDWNEYYKISCVRNPWDLCVSYYWWSIWSDREGLKSMVIDDSDSYATVIRKFKKFLFSPASVGHDNADGPESFKTTIDFLSRETDRFITDDIDFYIRFESIKEDLEVVCKNICIPFGEVPRFKSTQRKLPIHYTEYYDNIAKSVVADKFSKCIEKFKYNF